MYQKLKHKIETHWQRPSILLSILLFPLSIFYRCIILTRSWLYQQSIIHSQKHKLPILVVGNIHVGGTGKTPSVIYLSNLLNQKGFKIGLVSKGYGRKNNKTLLVDPDGRCEDFGDEPLLIAQKTGCPVVVSNKRNKAIQLLTDHYPDLDIIISDDGLQHYQMQRDLEIIIFPYQDIFKSLDLLPNGPLREPLSRLKNTTFLIVSNTPNQYLKKEEIKKYLPCKETSIYFSSIRFKNIYLINHPQEKIEFNFFKNKQVAAACAIAGAERFFAAFEVLALHTIQNLVYPDHQILPLDLLAKQYECVIITEKDAVKFSHFTFNNVFVLPIEISIEEKFTDTLIHYLNKLS